MAGSGTSRDFDRFVEENARPLLRQAYALTGDRQEAQDLTQETFERVWRSWERVAGLDSPSAWARHVLTNLAISSWRRQRTRLRHAARLAPSLHAEAATEHLDVAAAVRALPSRQRDSLVMHTVLGMSVAEVATQLGTSEATVRSWLSRARCGVAASLGLDRRRPAAEGGEQGGERR